MEKAGSEPPYPYSCYFFAASSFGCRGGKRKIENGRRRQIRAETCRRGEERDVGFALFLCRQAVVGVGLFYGLVCFGRLEPELAPSIPIMAVASSGCVRVKSRPSMLAFKTSITSPCLILIFSSMAARPA